MPGASPERPSSLNDDVSFSVTGAGRRFTVAIIDFTNVPYADSAGIGALVGAYVSRQRVGRSLALVGVCQRVRHALQVTRVEEFFRFFNSISDAEGAAASGK